jgi:hypothetical protein
MEWLFWYYVGFWITLALLASDGEPVGLLETVCCACYPVVCLIVLPYCAIRGMYED